MITQKQIAECYQPLFDHIFRTYNAIAVISEMDEIISVVEKVQDSLNELYRIRCDIEGCNNSSENQGGCWRETGYWCVCDKHSQMWREGKPQPKIKADAVEREKTRDKNGVLHYSRIETANK